MPQANLANQALLEDAKTQFLAVLNLEQEIDIREEHISLLFMHLKNSWKPSSDTHSQDMLPYQKNIQGISDFISKPLHETAHKAEQTQKIKEILHLIDELDPLYQEMQLLEKKQEELEQKLTAAGITQDQLLRYLESEGILSSKESPKN